MPSSITLKKMLEAGVHFGHRTQKWNPKMKPYIFTDRNGIHIIDLQQTMVNLNEYYDMIRDLVADGGTVLFVGTKRQAQESIRLEAERCRMSYVNHRWLGGTLTNWRTIRERIDALKKLERRRDAGEFDLLTKKEALILTREIEKLQLRLGGIRDMRRIPDMLIVVDTVRESTAVREANILNIPVMALVDTNSDPDDIDYIIPANDDAVRAIKLIIAALGDAVAEGQAMRKAEDYEQEEEEGALYYTAYDDYEAAEVEDDEQYLGESTLAKLRDSRLFDDENDDNYEDDDEDQPPYTSGPSEEDTINHEKTQHSGAGDIVMGDKAGRDINKSTVTVPDFVEEVVFSAYSPYKIQPNNRYGLYVYAHIEDAVDGVARDIQKFKDELGDSIPAPKKSKQKAKLQEGIPITVVPECDEVEFDPPTLTKKWSEPWIRFGFDLKSSDDYVDETLFIRISIQVAGIEIAHIKCAIEVIESEEIVSDQQVSNSNPLLESKMKSQTVTPYQRIFISYSRRDSSVAKSYKIAQTALGNDAFLDVDNLRSGEDWRAALARAIDEADIFQLFWSEHSANSEYCRYEWDYALKVRCPEDTCEGFVRPVYWREPMPSPPPELARINFRFVPFGDQDD